MTATEFSFTQKDITTVYDALLQCDGCEVARSLVGGGTGVKGAFPKRRRVLRATQRWASSLLRLASLVEPNYEASGRVLLPWKASHLAILPNMSWPDALGMRIAFPANVTPDRKARLLANVLLGMSYA